MVGLSSGLPASSDLQRTKVLRQAAFLGDVDKALGKGDGGVALASLSGQHSQAERLPSREGCCGRGPALAPAHLAPQSDPCSSSQTSHGRRCALKTPSSGSDEDSSTASTDWASDSGGKRRLSPRPSSPKRWSTLVVQESTACGQVQGCVSGEQGQQHRTRSRQLPCLPGRRSAQASSAAVSSTQAPVSRSKQLSSRSRFRLQGPGAALRGPTQKRG